MDGFGLFDWYNKIGDYSTFYKLRAAQKNQGDCNENFDWKELEKS